MKEQLNRLSEIRKELATIYGEKSRLEQEVIDELVELGQKEIDVDDYNLATLKWVFDTKIDYERLKMLYPEIYEMGLQTTFSANRALKAVDKKLFKMILDDCRTVEPHYELIYTKKKGKWKK